MNEKRVFYQVDDRKYTSFYESNLSGTNLLTVAEEQAKTETKNQATRYIHRHTLEVIKTFKVEDKPKETQIDHEGCRFEGCAKPSALYGMNSGSSFLFKYCPLHCAVLWHGKLSRGFAVEGKYQEKPYYTMLKISKAKAQTLIQRLLNFHEDCEDYNDHADKIRADLVFDLKKAGMVPAIYPRYQAKTMEVRSKDTIKQMCYTVVEAGGLA